MPVISRALLLKRNTAAELGSGGTSADFEQTKTTIEMFKKKKY